MMGRSEGLLVVLPVLLCFGQCGRRPAATGQQEEEISPEPAVAIARKVCEGVITIPDDAICETERQGKNIVVTFRIPISTPRPGSSQWP